MKTRKAYLPAFMLLLTLIPTYAQKSMIQPPFLVKGDTVAIVAPAGILKPDRHSVVIKAKKLLEQWGLHAIIGKHVYNQNGHFAGTDEERCEDFQNALDNPKVKAIWCVRGGYGSVRILDKLDYTLFKKHPKWIIGYSDITAFHNQMNVLGYQSIHSILCTSIEFEPVDTGESFKTFQNALFGNDLFYTVKSNKYNKTGIANGQLVGGNLTLLTNLLGSKTSIDTTGKIVFIEEIGEYRYAIDRMLQSLKRAGYFENCNGVIFGDISKVKYNTTNFGMNTYELILDVLKDYDFPILFDFPAGHEPDNRALYLGRTIQLNVSKEQTTVNFL